MRIEMYVRINWFLSFRKTIPAHERNIFEPVSGSIHLVDFFIVWHLIIDKILKNKSKTVKFRFRSQ